MVGLVELLPANCRLLIVTLSAFGPRVTNGVKVLPAKRLNPTWPGVGLALLDVRVSGLLIETASTNGKIVAAEEDPFVGLAVTVPPEATKSIACWRRTVWMALVLYCITTEEASPETVAAVGALAVPLPCSKRRRLIVSTPLTDTPLDNPPKEVPVPVIVLLPARNSCWPVAPPTPLLLVSNTSMRLMTKFEAGVVE